MSNSLLEWLGKTRASLPKSRNGCTNCKKRHIKCDEQKPTCTRCQRLDHPCIYLPPRPPSQLSKPPIRFQHYTPSICTTLPVNLYANELERHEFEYFEHEIARELSLGLGWRALGDLVLQISTENTHLRQAVLALGAIHERRQRNGSSCIEGENKELLTSALRHYHKAIHHFQLDLAHYLKRSQESAILFCMLFTLFDFLQGDDVAALTHVRGGVAILREFVQGTDILEMNTESSTGFLNMDISTTLWSSRAHLQHHLTQVFSYLDFWGSLWIDQAPILPALTPVLGFRLPSPSNNKVDDSLSIFPSLEMRVREFSYASQDSDSFVQAKQTLLHDLEQQHQVLQTLSFGHATESSLTSMKKHQIALTNLNYVKVKITLEACQPNGTSNYHFCTRIFQDLVSQASYILNSDIFPRKSPYDNNSPLSFPMGVIHPLYITAIYCLDLDICGEAIALLEGEHWVEGAWDSNVIARVARRKLAERLATKRDCLYDESPF